MTNGQLTHRNIISLKIFFVVGTLPPLLSKKGGNLLLFSPLLFFLFVCVQGLPAKDTLSQREGGGGGGGG